jgi:hypothetical protein
MHRPASRYRRLSLLGALTLAGCATIPAAPPLRSRETAAARFERIMDSVAAEGALDEDDAGSVPRVRLTIPPMGYAATRYVDASFRVSEDAYVLVVAVDRDRLVRVLYPDSPDQTGFVPKAGATRLARFFGGFGGGFSRYGASYASSQRLSRFGGEGVLLAIASDRPLHLERLTDGDGWDERRIEELVFEQSLPTAAQSVARAVSITGQEYTTDYTTFGGDRSLHGYSLASSYGGCGTGYSLRRMDAYAFGGVGTDGFGGPGEPFSRFLGYYQRQGRTYARYVRGGACSTPVYYEVPVTGPMVVPTDSMPRDTTAATSRQAVARYRRPPHAMDEGSPGSRIAPRGGSGWMSRRQAITPEARFPRSGAAADGTGAGRRAERRESAEQPAGQPAGQPVGHRQAVEPR